MFILSFHFFITFSFIRSRDCSFRAVKTCGTVLAKRRDFFIRCQVQMDVGTMVPLVSFFTSNSSFLFSFFLSFLLSFYISFSPPTPSLTLSSWFSLLSPSRKWLESKPRLFLIQNKLSPRPLFTVRIATNYNSWCLASAPIVSNNCAVPVTIRLQQTK